MKRIVTWFLSTVSVVVLLFGYHTSTSGALATPETVIPSTATPSKTGATGTPSGSSGGTSGSSRTRTVTGSVAHTQWGPVQVELLLGGSTITGVRVVQAPSGNPTDQAINSQALPILVQETVQKQSANIDMVSGATVTSTGYLQSLQAALDQAGL